jgi:hypothetical protein
MADVVAALIGWEGVDEIADGGPEGFDRAAG